jgi:hypothetical protein
MLTSSSLYPQGTSRALDRGNARAPTALVVVVAPQDVHGCHFWDNLIYEFFSFSLLRQSNFWISQKLIKKVIKSWNKHPLNQFDPNSNWSILDHSLVISEQSLKLLSSDVICGVLHFICMVYIFSLPGTTASYISLECQANFDVHCLCRVIMLIHD